MKLRTLPSSGPGAGQMYGEGVERLWGSTEKKSSLVGHRQLQNPLRKARPVQWLTWASTTEKNERVFLADLALSCTSPCSSNAIAPSMNAAVTQDSKAEHLPPSQALTPTCRTALRSEQRTVFVSFFLVLYFETTE